MSTRGVRAAVADAAAAAANAVVATKPDALAAAPAGAGEDSSDYGVPRSSVRDLLRGGGAPLRVLQAVYDWWITKRRRDPEHLPLLARLRQEALHLRARQAQLSTAHTDVLGLRQRLVRMRRLLNLVKRRERLKAQVAALHQAHFEAVVKERKLCNGGAASLLPTPGVGPMSGALPQPSVRPASTQKLGPLRGREAVPREVVPREVAPREVVPPLNGVTPAAGPFDSMLASGDTGSCSDTFGLGVTVGDDLVASCVDDGLFDAVNGDGGLDGNLSHADGGSPGSGARRSGRQGVSVDRFQE
jgi:hypothetical protein